MPIASGVIVAWPSTAASIPAGWTRETNLDSKYLRGAAAAANADLTSVFGTATHNHTSPAHTPIQNSHTHTFSAGANKGGTTVDADVLNVAKARQTHAHSSKTSNSATGTNNSVTITVDATSNDLSFVSAIFIKSDGTPTGIPNGAYAFFESDTLPTGWTRTAGDAYLKGAAAAGDGGGTGGSNSHTHTSPAHTHTQNPHSHASLASSASTQFNFGDSGGGVSIALDAHDHDVSLNNATPTNNSVTTTIDSASAEPVFKKINLIVNGLGSANLPDSVVAIWGGTHASIPTDWSRVTGMDGNFAKHANANGESLVTTGGSATHNHTASSCQPTQVAHNHTSTANTTNGTAAFNNTGAGAAVTASTDTHTHTWTIGNTTATNQACAVTIDACSSEANYPVHAKVIFIKYTSPSLPSGQPPFPHWMFRRKKWKIFPWRIDEF